MSILSVSLGFRFLPLLAFFGLAACSGGGGAGPSGDTPTPPTATAPTVSVTATPASVAYNAASTIAWLSTNSNSCTSSGGGGGGGVGTSGSFNTGALTATTTYTVTCVGATGQATGSATVTVAPLATAPTVSVTATPGSIAYNATSTIAWTSTNSTSCTSSPPGINGSAGSFTTPALTVSTTYMATCVGPAGTASRSITINVSPSTVGSTIANVAAACAAEPMRGNVYYYCDCGTGAEGDCVPGNNTNAGTSPSAPRQTVGSAASRFSTLAVNDTVALCKGGAFDASASLDIGSNRCGAGVACNDLREYTPTTFTGSAKPVINLAAGTVDLIRMMGDTGGVRVLNLKLNSISTTEMNRGVFLYNGAHDVAMCNLDIDGFDIGVYLASNEVKTNNIKLTGSNITRSRNQGYLGGGDNTQINYNYWEGNGSQTIFNHAVYFASNNFPVANVEFIGNHVRGQYGPTCRGVVVTGHIPVDGFRVLNNTVEIDAAAATAGCWGIGFGSSGYANRFLRNATISNNNIKNVGSVGLTVAECPGCVVENNLIIQNSDFGYGIVGIEIGEELPVPAGSRANDVSAAVKVRNNTIWFGPNVTSGGTGIAFRTAGTGHTVVNNTVNYSATTVRDPVYCFNYPNISFTYINNNHCASAATYAWAPGRDLAAWRTFSNFDTASFTGNPLFTAAGTDFAPAAGSPLIGTGNSIYKSILDMAGKTRPSPPAIGAFEP